MPHDFSAGESIVDEVAANAPSGMLADDAAITRLARLSLLEYERCRDREAKDLGGIRVSSLDGLVEARRSALSVMRNGTVANATSPYSDDALSLRFSEKHTGTLLYVAAWSTWLEWSGSRWAKDEVLSVFNQARQVCRIAAGEASLERGGNEIAKAVLGAGTVAAVERLARSDPRHARQADEFDADPWALNTPAGVVDLRTGKMRRHRADDMLTKVTGTAPGGECPKFLAFLRQITQSDEALIGYLHRFVGYTLTGLITEHAFLFAYGPGGNGKGVLFSIMSEVLGDYSTTAMQDVFTVGRNDQHSTNLAVQALVQWQPQASPSQSRCGNAAADELGATYIRPTQSGYGAGRCAQGRTARDTRVGHQGVPGLAEEGFGAPVNRHQGHGRIFCRAGQLGRVAR